jgi:ABC-type sugar transport system ATPase subunit
MSDNAILYLKNISKTFPGIRALRNVSFSLNKGEVVSLVGENGAGKSTLMRVIAGLLSPDEGEIFIEGELVKITNAAIADKLKIGIVHQEPTLVPGMSVYANIFLGREIVTKWGTLNFKKMKKDSMKILDTIGFKLNVDELVGHLSLVEKEVVEIAKAMLFDPKYLILDEVTAPLGVDEANHLFELILELKAKGLAIIFISHRLNEVIRLSDRVVVLRDGKVVGELDNKANITERDLIDLMLGDKKFERAKKAEIKKGKKIPVLEASNFNKKPYFENINFKLHKGEILGFAGLKGSGITEILRTIYALETRDSGDIHFNGQKIKIRDPKQALDKGIGMITNDRQKEGLALERNIEENMSISSLDFLTNKMTFLKVRTIKHYARTYIAKLEIKARSFKQEALNLSGGNQQKVVIAKLLLRGLELIMFDEPTRGIDVNAKNEIYKILLELKKDNKGIIITSPEIPELLNICDRIIVVSMGRIVEEVESNSGDFNEKSILEKMHSVKSYD